MDKKTKIPTLKEREEMQKEKRSLEYEKFMEKYSLFGSQITEQVSLTNFLLDKISENQEELLDLFKDNVGRY